MNGEPLSKIKDYALMEVLGSGAFGTVYKVKKTNTGHHFLALKEVSHLLVINSYTQGYFIFFLLYQ